MKMSEDEIIYVRVFFNTFLCVFIEHCVFNDGVVIAFGFFLKFFSSMIMRPFQGKSYSKVRVKPSEEELVEFTLIETAKGNQAINVKEVFTAV